MFEASFTSGALWKKIVECMKDLVNEANLDCSPAGVTIQAMDSSHVALVHLLMHFDGFSNYSCERNQVLGVSMQNLSKILKITDNSDKLTLRHEDDGDVLVISTLSKDSSKASEFQMKLMEIEGASLGIPDLDYRNRVTLPAAEFAKIVRDLAVLGDTVTVSLDRTGVKFSASGDIAEGYAFIRAGGVDKVKSESSVKGEVKQEVAEEDEDAPLVSAAKIKEEVAKVKEEAAEKDAAVEVTVEEPIALSFALRFFNVFGKGSALAERVTLCFAKDSPCMVEYKLEGMGYLRYYLAPKLDDTD
jgi:proliferating cell nuclear antigen